MLPLHSGQHYACLGPYMLPLAQLTPQDRKLTLVFDPVERSAVLEEKNALP